MQVQQLEQKNSDALVATAAYPRAHLVSCGSPSCGYIARSMADSACCSTPSTDGPFCTLYRIISILRMEVGVAQRLNR